MGEVAKHIMKTVTDKIGRNIPFVNYIKGLKKSSVYFVYVKNRLIVNNELTILLGSIETNYKLVNHYSLGAKTSYKTSIDNKIVQPETI